ncbi:MAG: MmgE/PrpD family protein [Acidobacteria bacterium]|nr:MmgE/PrpD family protein [Acidobacteriota bacterium]
MLSRRDVLGSSLALLAGGLAPGEAGAQEANLYGAALTGQGITTAFGRFLSGIRYEDLSPAALREARRAVLDWVGCALAGSTHPTVDVLLATFDDLGSVPTATVIGRPGRKLSLLDAAVANGQMGHILDFDDTHLGGVILHTSTATLPALFALGERRRSSGREVTVALAAAFEAGIRAGQAATSHHLGGWHLTGTLGTIAAAAGSARLIGLNETQTTYALGIACTQAAGMQQNRGSDCKSLHAGKSAYHGVLASTLASRGFNSSPEILEGSLGFTKVYSATQQNGAITAGLGRDWLIATNGYKPYACGVVLHPLIDAMIGVSRKASQPAGNVARIDVMVHPDVIRITGVDTPNSGLMSKFSANHAAAVAYIDQAAGVAQFTNERSADPAVQSLRRLITIKPDTSFRLDQSAAIVRTTSGASFEVQIDHATGTVSNPMSDQALTDKFMGNATPVLGVERARRVVAMTASLDRLNDIGELVRTLA